MLRRLAPVLLLVLLPLACAHKEAGPSTVEVHNEVVEEGQAQLSIGLSYEAKKPRRVEIILRLRVSGIVETEKLVAEVYIKGFNVEYGSTRWEGFVPPREPQTYRVTLGVPEDTDSARATVILSRSQDSYNLMHRIVEFSVGADGMLKGEVVPDG